jgi:hypothetical protein
MHKFITLGAAAVLVGVIGSSQATPLSTATGSANLSVERTMPSEGVTKAWYHGRHYGWYRGHHYGWRHRHWGRYAYRY